MTDQSGKPEVAKTLDEVTARVNKHIAEEVEKRVTAWLQATHGTDFVEHLKQTSAMNQLLRAHNKKFFALLKECYANLKGEDIPGEGYETALNHKLRTTIESVRAIKAPTGRIITP